MKLYEYQAKEILRAHGVAVPDGIAADRNEILNEPDAFHERLKQLNASAYVVKAQVHAGGRGKAGGVKITRNQEDVLPLARAMLDLTIKGLPVRRIYVEAAVDLAHEIYVSFLFDREKSTYSVMCSGRGGVDIEEVARSNPEDVVRISLDPFTGLKPFHLREILSLLPHSGETARALSATILRLYAAFVETDAELLEINPLVVTGDGKVFACDGKMLLDDNALFRHRDFLDFEDLGALDPMESAAREAGLSYVKLDGQIACLVNGAGLAMATMDVIRHFGGHPANFLDIGGSAKASVVENAMGLILEDKAVKAIFVNIFGGIVRTDEVARGVLAAVDRFEITLPLVIRLVGTNDREALAMLRERGFDALNEMNPAVEKAVHMAAPSGG